MSELARVWDGVLHAATHQLNEATRKLRQLDGRWNTPEAEIAGHVEEARLLVREAARKLQALDLDEAKAPVKAAGS
jgi:hypothetical protein